MSTFRSGGWPANRSPSRSAPGWTALARRLACQPLLTRVSGERRLERETGIEPATNSLEGCDSTTELLPHPISDRGLRSADAIGDSSVIRNPKSALRNSTIPLMVAREGLEPSKPLGRQIYSLLRLTASLPRRCLFLECVALVITLQTGCCSLQEPLSGSSSGPPPSWRSDGAGEGI